MNNTDTRQNLSAQPICCDCGLAIDENHKTAEYFQQSMGLPAAWAHEQCTTPALKTRLSDSLARCFGLNALPSTEALAPPWRHLRMAFPINLELFTSESGEVVAVKSRWDSWEIAETLAIADSLGLSVSPLLDAAWLIAEEAALAFTERDSELRASLRSQNPKDRCFTCGYYLQSIDPVLDFAAAGLGCAHDSCLADARELAWHEFSLQWGIQRHDGPWCLHLLGKQASAVENRQHAQWCELTRVHGGRAMDHPRAWTVAADSPWAAFVRPGSLLITSEPYRRESLHRTDSVVVDDLELDVFVYPEVHLHNADLVNGFATELHVWVPHDGRAAA